MLVQINSRFVRSGTIFNDGKDELAAAAWRASFRAARGPIYRYTCDLRAATTTDTSLSLESAADALAARWI